MIQQERVSLAALVQHEPIDLLTAEVVKIADVSLIAAMCEQVKRGYVQSLKDAGVYD